MSCCDMPSARFSTLPKANEAVLGLLGTGFRDGAWAGRWRERREGREGWAADQNIEWRIGDRRTPRSLDGPMFRIKLSGSVSEVEVREKRRMDLDANRTCPQSCCCGAEQC